MSIVFQKQFFVFEKTFKKQYKNTEFTTFINFECAVLSQIKGYLILFMTN